MVEKITKWLYLEPLIFKREYVHLSEISRVLGKNHTVARQYLNYFEKQGFVKKKKVGKMILYKLVENHSLFIQIVSLIEKEKLIQKSENLVLREVVGFIDAFDNCAVLVFGSFVDDPKKAGDVDLLIVGKIGNLDFKKLENKINKRIHLIQVNSFSEINSALMEEIRKKHFIVKNVEEVVKWLI